MFRKTSLGRFRENAWMTGERKRREKKLGQEADNPVEESIYQENKG